MAELGTRLAHVDGGVPNIRISVPRLNAYYVGQLIYFFEIACGISPPLHLRRKDSQTKPHTKGENRGLYPRKFTIFVE